MEKGNWWDKYKIGDVSEEETSEEAGSPIPEKVAAKKEEAPEGGNWWDKYAISEPVEDDEDAEKTLLSNWESTTQQFEDLRSGYEGLGSRYKELSSMESRTPEQEKDLQDTWNNYVKSGFGVQAAIKKVETLQPEIDSFNERQKSKRVDYIETQRGSAMFGNEVADGLYDIDARAESEYAKARELPDKDKRKEAFAQIRANFQTEETQLLQSRIDAFKENEEKINNAAEVIGQAFSTQAGDQSGNTVDQFLLETNAGVEEYAELRDSLLNQDDPEKGRLFKEASLMYRIADGSANTGVVNGEVRISPSAVWNAELVKEEINNLDVSESQKKTAIDGIPAMQEEAAKMEFPFLQKVNEFNDFVKDNNLQGESPKDQISEWKSRNRNWSEMVTKAPAQIGIGLTQGALGILEAGQAIVGATALTMGAQNFGDYALDIATQTGEKNQELARISQEIGGPTLLAEIAAVAPQIGLQIATGKAVGFGGAKMGFSPKVVSNLGFGSSVATGVAQSYGMVLSAAFQQLEKEKIDGGMDPTQARAEAIKEAQLPAALSGLSTAIVTTIGGKRGVEGVFREGADGIKAKLNTEAFKAQLPKFIPDVVKGMRNEGYEEFVDQLAQGIIEQFTFNPDLSTSDIVNNAFKALIIGGIAGGSVEGLKYGFDYVKAPYDSARRKASMASIRDSISIIEREISESSASSPIGVEFQREYDITLPSDEAASLGASAIDRNRMASLQSEREQIQELLKDTTISRVARNQIEQRLAAADYNYYNDVLVPGRFNILTEQVVDDLDGRPISASSRDAIVALTKISNNSGLDSLSGRERVAVGITKAGDNRYLPTKENPLVETDGQGNVSITNTGKRVAETLNIVPLTRMIGLSDQAKLKIEENAKLIATLQEEEAKREAKELADSEDSKRYGPASAEALKAQVNNLPATPEGTDEKVAQLLKDEQEAKKKAEAAILGTSTIPPVPTEVEPPPTLVTIAPDLTDPSTVPVGPESVRVDQENAAATNAFLDGLEVGEYTMFDANGEPSYVLKITQSKSGRKRHELHDVDGYVTGEQKTYVGDRKAVVPELNFGRVVTPEGETKYIRSTLQNRVEGAPTTPTPTTPTPEPESYDQMQAKQRDAREKFDQYAEEQRARGATEEQINEAREKQLNPALEKMESDWRSATEAAATKWADSVDPFDLPALPDKFDLGEAKIFGEKLLQRLARDLGVTEDNSVKINVTAPNGLKGTLNISIDSDGNVRAVAGYEGGSAGKIEGFGLINFMSTGFSLATNESVRSRNEPVRLERPSKIQPSTTVSETLEPLRRVTRAEQTPEDVTALTDAGLIEIYKDQPVLTQAGIDALPETERPRLTPEARKIQIDTRTSDAVAEAISKNLRIGVDQVPFDVKMPEGWTIDGDIYIPPATVVEPPVTPPAEPPVTSQETPVTILNYDERAKPIQDKIDARIEELLNGGMTFQEANKDPSVRTLIEQRMVMDRGAIDSYRDIVNDAFLTQGIANDGLSLSPAFSIMEDVYGSPPKGSKGLLAIVYERGQEALGNDEQTIRKLSEAIFKYQAEEEGLIPEELLGPNSGLTTEGMQARVDESRTAAEAIHSQIKNRLTGPVEAAPPVSDAASPTPTAVGATAQQARDAISEARKEREGKAPLNVGGRSKYGPTVLSPKKTIGKLVREVLRAASRLNLSKIANSDPNEVLMQDVAAILSKLKLPILDTERVVSLSSIRDRTGRPKRTSGRGGKDPVVALPSTTPMSIETFVHEVGHTLTASQIRKYVDRRKFKRGKEYFDAINKVIADPKTPEPIKRLFTLYVSTIQQLGVTEQYFGDKGIAGGPKPDTSKSMARRLQGENKLRKDLDAQQLYGLANVEEFVSQTFSSTSFRNLLKGLKDPTNSSKSLWSAFVEAIQNLLSLPEGSMAAGVIEVSIDVASTVDPATRDSYGNIISVTSPDTGLATYPSIGININDEPQSFTSQILAGDKTIETRDSDSLRPYVGKRVGIVKTGDGPAVLVGYATVGEPIVYNNESEFRADEGRHLVAKGSKRDIKSGGVKYGYPLTNVEEISPVSVKSQGRVARQIPQPVDEADASPDPETGKTVEMTLDASKEAMFQLFGERMYTAGLSKVVVKETVQNAFDGIKDSEETGEIPKGSGVIAYSRKSFRDINGEEKVRMTFTDNGAGMTTDILQKAFFTVGGSFKRSGKGSGGFGIAKLGMFMSADSVMVETVRDGVKSVVKISKEQLRDKKFDAIVSSAPDRKNGTMVVLEFPEKVTKSDGTVVDFENPFPDFQNMIRHDILVINDNYGTYEKEIVDKFRGEPESFIFTWESITNNAGVKPPTFEKIVKDVPNAEVTEREFPVIGAKKPIKVRIAAIRLGMKSKDGKDKYREEFQVGGKGLILRNSQTDVYSNGLYQFQQSNLKLKPLELFKSPRLPYHFIVDIDAGGVDAKSLSYPFQNNREGFQDGAIKNYVSGFINDVRLKEVNRQFDQTFGLLTDISGGKPRKDSPSLYNNTTIVPQPFEQKFLEDLSRAVFDVADDLVVALRKGYEDKILEDAWYKVKSQKGLAPTLAESNEDTLDYFYGVGLSKNWGGVNTSREPVSALVNPIYEERVDDYAKTEFGRRILARMIAKTLIHELIHHLHRNEGSDFTFFILQNETYLGEVGAIQSAVDKILPIVNQHSDAIISLKSKFRTAETKDNDNELTGEQYERSSKEADGQPRTIIVGGNRVVRQPSGEVSARPTSEEDGEQAGAYLPSSLTAGGRQDAGVGEGVSFGEVLSSSLIDSQAQISEEGISRDDQGNVIPLSQRFDDSEEDINRSIDEELEIIEGQVPQLEENTPEASTVKVMEDIFQLADQQSVKGGSVEGTFPLATITGAWLNSGLNQSALEDAIIRYTNLGEETAANFAEAFVQQYKTQKGLFKLGQTTKKRSESRAGTYSFPKRVEETGKLPKEVADRIGRIYEVLRNEVSLEEATEALRGLSVEEAITAIKDMKNGISFPVRSTMVQVVEKKILNNRKILKDEGNTKDYDAAVDAHIDFVNWASEYAKELGQGVQAFAQWINLGVDGIARKLRRDTEAIVGQAIKSRKKKIDKIKSDIEEGDSKSFDEAKVRSKEMIEDLGDAAGKEEASKLSIEDQAQKIAQRLAKRVEGEVKARTIDPLSELVNNHVRNINENFVQEAIALGISPDTANKIDVSAKKLDQDRREAKDQREAFRIAQEARVKISKDLARENKYIYGERPTIWENYQAMFADRFARALLRDPKKSVPPALALFTNRLTQNLIGFIPETTKQASTPQSFQAFIEDALNNKERYLEAFNKAMEDISQKVDELPFGPPTAAAAKMIAANEFMKKLAPVIADFPVSEKTVNRFVIQKTKDLGVSLSKAYNSWYRSDRKTRREIEARIAEQLIGDVNIDIKDAQRLSKSIVKDFKQRAEERRKQALERFKAPKEKIKPDRAARTDKLQRFFELANMGALSDKDAYELLAERFGLPVYDEDFVRYVEEAVQVIQGMDEGLSRRLKTQELMSEITRNRGFDPADIGAGFVYANILSSPDTHMVNIIDTLLNNFANGIADAIATGDISRLRGIVKGYRKGIFEAAEIMKTGKRINVPGFEEKAPMILELLVFGEVDEVKLASLEGANAIVKSLLESRPAYILNAMKYVGRLLESQDAFNFVASAEGERYAQASRLAAEDGLKGADARKRMNEILNLSDEAYQSALNQAEIEGYTGAEMKYRAMEIQDEKIPKEIKEAGFNRGLRDVYRNMPVGVAGLMSDKVTNAFMSIKSPLLRNSSRLVISPFIITPINLFNKWLDWSPWGYKRMFYGTGNWAGGKYYVEPYEKGSPERRAQMLKASSSILLMTTMWALVRAGVAVIHGRGPTDEEERKQWSDDGNKPYTIQIGNSPAVSFVYTPWALMLTWMANAENYNRYNLKEGEDEADLFYRMAASAALVPAVLEGLPFYGGVADLIGAAEDLSKFKGPDRFMKSKIGMLFPNLFRYFDRLFDPKAYTTEGVKGLLIDQIPFVRRIGGARLNMFGEPIGEGKKFYEQLTTRFFSFPNPSRESLILAKYDAYPYIPNTKQAKALVNGEPSQMTAEQYDKFVRGMGQEFKQYVLDNFDPDVEISPEEKELGKKRMSKALEGMRARWVREVSTY